MKAFRKSWTLWYAVAVVADSKKNLTLLWWHSCCYDCYRCSRQHWQWRRFLKCHACFLLGTSLEPVHDMQWTILEHHCTKPPTIDTTILTTHLVPVTATCRHDFLGDGIDPGICNVSEHGWSDRSHQEGNLHPVVNVRMAPLLRFRAFVRLPP
jgi:hypothetical protein